MKHVARLLVGVLAGLMLSACVSSGPNLDPGPETSFQPIRTETLFSIRYKPEERELTVVLRTGDVIDYADVPPEAAEGLLNAEDKDAFYRNSIEAVYKGRKLEF